MLILGFSNKAYALYVDQDGKKIGINNVLFKFFVFIFSDIVKEQKFIVTPNVINYAK